MFYARAHGEGFRLQGEAGVEQHLEGVPRAVAGGEDEARGLYALGDAAGADEDAAQGAVFDIEALKPGTEADLAAEALDLAPEADDDAGEHVGAEVGLGVVGDGGLGAVLYEGIEDEGDARVVGAGAELAVGEGAGAALAELDVGLGVKAPAGAEGGYGALALLHAGTAFEDDGPELCAGED